MSKPMKKSARILLILLIVVVLLIACFISVAVYAKMEFNKERSWLPAEIAPQQASVTELPDNAHDAYAYAMRLYNEAIVSDFAEGSWHTDVDLGGDVQWPFSENDNRMVNEIRTEAAGALQALYPTVSSVKMSDEAADELPVIDLKEEDVLEYVYDAGAVFNRKGEYNSDTYELVFKVDPAFEDVKEVKESAVYAGVCEALKDAMTVNDALIEVREVEIRFRIDRLTDQMQSVAVKRVCEIKADVTLTDAYAALAQSAGKDRFTVTLPYKATEQISFMWYGLRFTEDYLEQKPDDMIALPLEVHVNGGSVQGEDFELTYDISDPETLEIDKDAVLTVNKATEASATGGVHVTAVLTYEGKTYTDDITIYVTELEKTTTGVRFWKEGVTLETGKTEALPVEIRVPVNEQSEQRTEEEYELFIEISNEEALAIEVDNKDLYATALKSADGPVTVKVTLKCGGHTYTAELPVTITNGTEATDNG